MKKKDILKDGYYSFYSPIEKHHWLVRSTEDGAYRGIGICISVSKPYFEDKIWLNSSIEWEISFLSEEQKRWVDHCILVGEYVDFETLPKEIINTLNYEIF